MSSRLCALVLFVATGCRTSLDWRSHLSLRASEELRLSYIDPAEQVEAVVSKNLHYVSIALEAAFFRNLPGVTAGGSVALGIEIEGLLPKNQVLRTVVGVDRARSAEGALIFENAFSTQPVVYGGQSIGVSLYLRTLDADAAPAVRGRLSGAGDVARKIDPRAETAIRLGTDLFRSIVESAAAKTPPWSYSIRLHPSDSIHRDKPEMLFTAARHVLLLLPPPSAPESLRKVRPGELVGKLRLSGSRLVWSDSGVEYTDSPYVVLSVTRFRRYPNPESPLRQAVRRMESLLEQGLYPQALAYGRIVAREIAADRVVSVVERNLERSWLELRYARIRAETAREANQPEEELKHTLRQLERLATLRDDFQEVLEPAERRDIEHRASRLATRAGELGQKLGRAPDEMQAALKPFAGKLAAAQGRERAIEEAVRSVRGQVSQLQAEMLRRQEALSRELRERSQFLPKIYRQAWFWTLVGLAVAGTGTALWLGLRKTETPEAGATVPPLPRALRAR
jgi:hypothetical protein